jgi:hypothetical protein
MQLGSYGEEKIDVSLINTGIRFLQKFLSAGTGSRIIIPKNYSDKSIGYKYSLISKPYNAYLDNRNNTDELLLKEVADAFGFNLLLKYGATLIKTMIQEFKLMKKIQNGFLIRLNTLLGLYYLSV